MTVAAMANAAATRRRGSRFTLCMANGLRPLATTGVASSRRIYMNPTMQKPPPLPASEYHWSPDSLIRWAGFSIAERPTCGPAVWVCGRVRLVHEGALAVARRKWRQKLKELEGKK